MEFVKETSPYLRKKASLTRMLLDVIIALLPCVIMAIVSYGIYAVRNVVLSLIVMLAAETLYVLIRYPLRDGKKHTAKENIKYAFSNWRMSNLLAPIVSALIFALIMPAKASKPGMMEFAIIVGAASGLILGKLVYGGTGNNIFNPAAVGMVIAKICFGSSFSYESTGYITSITGGGTLLEPLKNGFASIADANILDMFIGRIPGTIGEACKIAIIVGALYLFIRRAGSFYPTIGYIGGFIIIMSFVAIPVCLKYGYSYWQFMGFELFSGGLLFGAVFMLTDPVTTPITSPGRLLCGIIAASLTAIIRLFAPIPEGVVYSILIVNLVTPAIDYRKWCSNGFTPKKIIWMASILICVSALCALTVAYGGYLK